MKLKYSGMQIFKFKKTKLRVLEVSQENQVETFDYLNDLKIDLGKDANSGLNTYDDFL